MGKFSKNETISEQIKNRPDATINYEGGIAFELDAKTRLYTEVVTSLFSENKFYESAAESDAKIRKDIQHVAYKDPEFILQLAAYARNEMHMRSVPQVLLAEASVIPECKPFVRDYAPKIIKRADEPSEVIAYWISRFGQIGSRTPPNGQGPNRLDSFPNSLKKGISDALENFDEYQLEKYNRKGSVTLRDVLRIVHPVPEDETRSALYKYLISGELQDPEGLPIINAKRNFTKKSVFDAEARQLMKDGHLTWEVAISQFGNKKEIWDQLNLPIFATLRNLRNLVLSGANLKDPLEKLSNPEIIRRSKILPFRFYTAVKEIENMSDGDTSDDNTSEVDRFVLTDVRKALNTALNLSVANVPEFPGRTAILVDLSGSMESRLSARGKTTMKDLAAIFGAVTHVKSNSSIIIGFGSEAAQIFASPQDDVLSIVSKIRDTNVGYSTDAWKAVKMLSSSVVDRVVLFSDMQVYDSWYGTRSIIEEWVKYTHKMNPHAYLYSIDLTGYGTVAIPQDLKNAALIAGWSEKIYDFISAFEGDKRATVEKIKEMYS